MTCLSDLLYNNSITNRTDVAPEYNRSVKVKINVT